MMDGDILRECTRKKRRIATDNDDDCNFININKDFIFNDNEEMVTDKNNDNPFINKYDQKLSSHNNNNKDNIKKKQIDLKRNLKHYNAEKKKHHDNSQSLIIPTPIISEQGTRRYTDNEQSHRSKKSAKNSHQHASIGTHNTRNRSSISSLHASTTKQAAKTDKLIQSIPKKRRVAAHDYQKYNFNMNKNKKVTAERKKQYRNTDNRFIKQYEKQQKIHIATTQSVKRPKKIKKKQQKHPSQHSLGQSNNNSSYNQFDRNNEWNASSTKTMHDIPTCYRSNNNSNISGSHHRSMQKHNIQNPAKHCVQPTYNLFDGYNEATQSAPIPDESLYQRSTMGKYFDLLISIILILILYCFVYICLMVLDMFNISFFNLYFATILDAYGLTLIFSVRIFIFYRQL